MNYGEHPQQQQPQQQYMMPQGQRMQNPRMMTVPTNMGHNMPPRQQRYPIAMMQPGQQPSMSIAPPGQQYVQSPGMPRGQMSFPDAHQLSRLPLDVQQQLNTQQQLNVDERKRQIAIGYIQGHGMRQMNQNFQNQGPMGPSGSVMVNMNRSQAVPMAQGNMGGGPMLRMSGTSQNANIQQTPIYQNQSPQMQPALQQVTAGQIAMQRVTSSHGYPPSGLPSLQPFQSSQEQPAAGTSAIPNYNSPQPPSVSSQPSSVGPSIQQGSVLQQKGPSSVPPSGYAQHHPSESGQQVQGAITGEGDKASAAEEPLYNEKLKQLKIYHEQVKRMIERNRLDGVVSKHMYERLLEIMENRRKVELKLVEKLIVSVKSMVDRSSLCYPLLELLNADPSTYSQEALKNPLPGPWDELRPYFIRVPEELMASSSEGTSSMLKRPVSGSGAIVKRAKRESDSSSAVAKAESAPAEKVRGMITERDGIICVSCLDGSQIELPREASEQIRGANFSVDPDLIPISNECTEVVILFENDLLLVPPLRVVVPTNYPECGASIWRDQWSFGGTSLSDVYVQFEKRLGMASNSRSISEILSAWRTASEHALRIGSTTK